MSHRPGQKTSAARASDSYHPLHSNTHLQPPSFYHFPLCLLLRPSNHPPLDLLHDSILPRRAARWTASPHRRIRTPNSLPHPFCIVHVNGTLPRIGERPLSLVNRLPSSLYHRCQLFHLHPFLRLLHPPPSHPTAGTRTAAAAAAAVATTTAPYPTSLRDTVSRPSLFATILE